MSKKSSSKNSETDLQRIDAMNDEDIDFSDCPEVTADMMKNAVLRRGLKVVPRKQEFTIVLDSDVAWWFLKQGKGYKTKINELLRAHMEEHETKAKQSA